MVYLLKHEPYDLGGKCDEWLTLIKSSTRILEMKIYFREEMDGNSPLILGCNNNVSSY